MRESETGVKTYVVTACVSYQVTKDEGTELLSVKGEKGVIKDALRDEEALRVTNVKVALKGKAKGKAKGK